MHQNAFDALSRGAAAVSRRNSLLTLGGAGIAAAIGGSSLTAAKNKKKKNKSKKKCNQQKSQCQEVVEEVCQENTVDPADEAECIAQFSPCCAQCNVAFGVSCFFDILVGP